MPNDSGKGKVDYVLWGDDGRPLAIVEAKRTRENPTAGQQQAKLYADCLERQFDRQFVQRNCRRRVWGSIAPSDRTVELVSKLFSI
ncbi:MAG: hypothetical protein KME17_25045 [Cyanosarcina radialis HA8281-LM2]|jgi:type I restriction enzyme R subunit|nr:hypothetical protein [Cyanosarcina radialis HA8281-LM2]